MRNRPVHLLQAALAVTAAGIGDTAKCRHCGAHIAPPPPIIGDTNDQRIARHLSLMTEHLQTHDRGKPLIVAAMHGNEYANLMMLSNYETGNPDILHQHDFARWRIHTSTRRATVSDEKIAEKVKALGLSEDDSARVAELLKEMRDVIEERGRYQTPAPLNDVVMG